MLLMQQKRFAPWLVEIYLSRMALYHTLVQYSYVVFIPKAGKWVCEKLSTNHPHLFRFVGSRARPTHLLKNNYGENAFLYVSPRLPQRQITETARLSGHYSSSSTL